MLLRTAIDGDNPTARYRSRVVADGGTVSNYGDVQKIVQMLKTSGRFKNVKLLWYGGAGVKLRTSGVNSYVSKAYSVQLPANDLAQTTELSQPWQSGNIAQNEKPCVKNSSGSNRKLTLPTQTFTASNSWSFVWAGIWDGSNNNNAALAGKGHDTQSNILFRSAGTNRFAFMNESGTLVEGTSGGTNSLIGKISVVHFVANGTSLDVYKNGVFYETLTVNTNFVLTTLLMSMASTATGCNGRHYYFNLDGSLTASQVAAEYNTLRALIPERESVTIGSQAWTTSNLDIVCDAQGVVIPEVTDNAAWAALTTPAWCHYNNDPANGAIFGKLYNWYAVKQIDDALAATGSEWRVPTQAQFNTLATQLGGTSVAGGKMKVAGTSYFASPNTGATNESGFSALGSGLRLDVDGVFYSINSLLQTCAIDEVSVSNCMVYYINKNNTIFDNGSFLKKRGMSIRLVKTL